jgi:hypothetical protein
MSLGGEGTLRAFGLVKLPMGSNETGHSPPTESLDPFPPGGLRLPWTGMDQKSDDNKKELILRSLKQKIEPTTSQ